MSLLPYLHRVADRQNLPSGDALEAMRIILSGAATPAQIAGFLVALRMKGETVDELVGFARALRQMAEPVDVGLAGEPLLDTCGTGGDGFGDVQYFHRRGVRGGGRRRARGQAWQPLDIQPVRQRRSAGSDGRAHSHAARANARAPSAKSASAFCSRRRFTRPPGTRIRCGSNLKMRTVFNLLGPLTNPAGASAQLAGAPSAHFAELIAGALAALGLQRGFVVHGSDGLDEITTTGPTLAFEIRHGDVARRTLTPDDFGVPFAQPADLKGGDRATTSAIARAILAGVRRSAARHRAGERRRGAGGRWPRGGFSGRHGTGRGGDRFRGSARRKRRPWPGFTRCEPR